MTGRAVFPNADLSLSLACLRAYACRAADKYEALLLPDEAIGTDLTQHFVFVVNEQNTVEYRKVEPGPIIDGLRVIRDGLTARGLGDCEWCAAGEDRGQGRSSSSRQIPADRSLPRPQAAVAKP